MAIEDPKGSFIRWQSITIGQLTYAVNLILSFSVATLGFQVTLLLDDKFLPVSWQKCFFANGLFLIGLSIALGLAVVINRLRDFRATMKAARLREDNHAESDIEPSRILYRKLGDRTWVLFWWQLGTFAAGVLSTILAVLASLSSKLI